MSCDASYLLINLLDCCFHDVTLKPGFHYPS